MRGMCWLVAGVVWIITILLLSSCVSYGPSEWSPMSHVAVMRQCRVACHPGRMSGYSSMDGECTCEAKTQKKEGEK